MTIESFWARWARCTGDEYDAVVSLCRVGKDQVRVAQLDHAEYWLIDSDENEHLDFIVRDAVSSIE